MSSGHRVNAHFLKYTLDWSRRTMLSDRDEDEHKNTTHLEVPLVSIFLVKGIVLDGFEDIIQHQICDGDY